MIEVALRALIMGSTSAVGPRVMPVTELADVRSDLPKVVHTLVSSPFTMTGDGPDDITTARFQLDIFAEKLTTAVTGARPIADAIRVALNGYSGTVGGVEILLIRFDGEGFSVTKTTSGAGAAPARFTQDIFVTYRI